MAIFLQRFTIESPFPVDQTWKKLMAVVKTDPPACPNCGQILVGGRAARFCSNCGQPVTAQPGALKSWAARVLAMSARLGFEFEGYVSPKEFLITRIISYRNCCIPVIHGRFEPSNGGTRIAIEMRMHALGYVFLVPGSLLSFGALSAVFYGGDKAPSSALLYLLPFAAPCFLGLICWLAFAAEVGIARGALDRIWESIPQLARH